MNPSILSFVQSELKSHSGRPPHSPETSDLTIGVEHEFFLFDKNHKTPASLEQSQAFLKKLATQSGWKKFSSANFGKSTSITRVSHEAQPGKYTAVKYEFPPHMMEVAFTYHPNLNDLFENISRTWDTLQLCARAVDLTLCSQAMIPPPALLLSDQIKIDPKLERLGLSRREHFLRRGEKIDPTVVDFPSFTAATQTHIGGLNWWNDSSIIHCLYLTEPYFQPLGFRSIRSTEKDAVSLFRQRWSTYEAVFKDLPLLGFPDFTYWDLSTWTDALAQTPIYLDDGHLVDASHLSPEMQAKPLQEIFGRIRDLQLIRPKLIGTLEFRADPAQCCPRSIIRQAALRLVQCLWARSLPKNHLPFQGDFREARIAWRKALHGPFAMPPNDPTLEEIAESLLKSRGLDENRFLELPRETQAA